MILNDVRVAAIELLICLLVAVVARAKMVNINIKAREPFSFIALGDWGGRDTAPFVTSVQLLVAKQMQKYAEHRNVSFVAALGDNFYFNGVDSPNDKRFRLTYENVYLKHRLRHLKWYVIAGNHDHRKNRSGNQIAHSKLSSQWVFPDLFYTITVRVKLRSSRHLHKHYKLVRILMIDTTVLCTLYDELYETDMFDKLDDMYYRQLLDELDESFDDVGDDGDENRPIYLAMGHHPIHTNMMHRNASSCMRTDLKALLLQYNITIYISGHDHTLQYSYLSESRGDDEHVHSFVSGAGAGLYRVPSKTSGNSFFVNQTDTFYWSEKKARDGGFLVMDLYENHFEFRFINTDGLTIYSRNKVKY